MAIIADNLVVESRSISTSTGTARSAAPSQKEIH